jgi:hypothetical protein
MAADVASLNADLASIGTVQAEHLPFDPTCRMRQFSLLSTGHAMANILKVAMTVEGSRPRSWRHEYGHDVARKCRASASAGLCRHVGR